MTPEEVHAWWNLAEKTIGVFALTMIGFGWAAFQARRAERTDHRHQAENEALLKILEIYARRFDSSAKANSASAGDSTNSSVDPLTLSNFPRMPPSSGSED